MSRTAMRVKHDDACAALASALDAHQYEIFGVTAGTVHEGIRVYGPFVTWDEAAVAAEALGGKAFTIMGRDITRDGWA